MPVPCATVKKRASIKDYAIRIALCLVLAFSCVPSFALANEGEEGTPESAPTEKIEQTAATLGDSVDTTSEDLPETPSVQMAAANDDESLQAASAQEEEALQNESRTEGSGDDAKADAENIVAETEGSQGLVATANARATVVPGDQGPYTVGAFTYAGTKEDPIRIVKGSSVDLPFHNKAVEGCFVGSDPYSSQDGNVYASYYGNYLQGMAVSSTPSLVSGKAWFGSSALESFYVSVVATEAELDPNPIRTHQVSFDWNLGSQLKASDFAELPELSSTIEGEEGDTLDLPIAPEAGASFTGEPMVNVGCEIMFLGWTIDGMNLIDKVAIEKQDIVVKALWSARGYDLALPGARGPYLVGGTSYAGTADDPIIVQIGKTIQLQGAIGSEDAQRSVAQELFCTSNAFCAQVLSHAASLLGFESDTKTRLSHIELTSDGLERERLGMMKIDQSLRFFCDTAFFGGSRWCCGVSAARASQSASAMIS